MSHEHTRANQLGRLGGCGPTTSAGTKARYSAGHQLPGYGQPRQACKPHPESPRRGEEIIRKNLLELSGTGLALSSFV